MNVNRLNPRHEHNAGKYIGNYHIIRLLGKGGFAAVYLGEHRYLGTLAAVKVLRAGMNDADERNFHLEARIAGSLVHSHIIRVLEFGMEHGMPFLVMDYAAKGTVRQLYPYGSQMAPHVLVKYVKQVADALQYVHNRGLVHRDIKPENLLLGDNNQLLLSDFGISTIVNKPESRAEVIAGTAAYMAPELIEGAACFASDQYALGVVVYEWLCGEWPFQGDPDEILDKHLYDFPPPLREYIPGIPAAVEKVVLKALAKNPQDRFASILEFAAALKAAFGYGPVVREGQSPSSLGQPAASEPASREEKQQQDIWREMSILFALDLFAAIVVGIVSYTFGVAPQLLWILLSLCVVLFALGGALVMKSRALFLLACGLTIVAALPGMIFHSAALFVLLYIILLSLSLPAAFATSIQFQGEGEARPEKR